MTETIGNKPCENQGAVIRMAEVFDRLMAGVKAGWLSRVTGICESTIAEMRNGKRRIPAVWVPLLDSYIGGHALLDELASMEGFGIHDLEASPLNASDLERLFPLILREQGQTAAEVFQALRDGVIDPAERDTLHQHFAKLARFFAEAEARTAPAKIEVPA